MSDDSDITLAITAALLLLAVLGAIWVDRVLVGFAVVAAIMLALSVREAR